MIWKTKGDNQIRKYDFSHDASSLGDFRYTGSKTTASIDYGYDKSENSNSDNNRAIASISYNYMNLPATITFSNGKGTIVYVYDAAGNKLQIIATENSASVPLNRTSYPSSIVTTTSYAFAGTSVVSSVERFSKVLLKTLITCNINI